MAGDIQAIGRRQKGDLFSGLSELGWWDVQTQREQSMAGNWNEFPEMKCRVCRGGSSGGWARKISRARIWSCAHSFPNLLVFWKVHHAGSLASCLPGKFSDWGHKCTEQKRSQDGFPSLSLKRLHLLHDSSFHQTLLIHGPSFCQTSSCRSSIFF